MIFCHLHVAWVNEMTRSEFDRQIFGDTTPHTEIDYDYHRRVAARERRAAIVSFPGQVARRIGSAWRALSRLRHGFMRLPAP
jgi:hypothetical protein